jgi:hypothetical protein
MRGMTHSKARRFLSRLADEFGSNGALIIQKSTPGTEGEDLLPGSALRWPACECGHPLCPDYRAPAPEASAGELSARVAERNRRSRRGGL